MTEWELKEVIELQRFKIRTLEKQHEDQLEELQGIFKDILKELGADKFTLSELMGMSPHNMRCTLYHIRDRNTPDTAGWYRYHGLKARGE